MTNLVNLDRFKIGKLPDFVIIGVQKCGTTTLERNLSKHPEIYMTEYCHPGSSREVHFFDTNYKKGADWYRSLFRDSNGRICGEKTPKYITNKLYMERLYSTIPDAKLIISLRDPVKRLISQINMRKKRFPDLKLEDVINDDEYIGRGFYYSQIKNNVLSFYKKEKVHIVIIDKDEFTVQRNQGIIQEGLQGLSIEDNTNHTKRIMNEVFKFLEVSQLDLNYSYYYVGKYESDLGITEELLHKVKNIYKIENEKLFDFLGYRIDSWL
ncbi:MAG: sulfotransferase [Crocosphaera sp.]|nr:sulfotransferase [Crocosphaera sp.]